jgi:hypothetical protein
MLRPLNKFMCFIHSMLEFVFGGPNGCATASILAAPAYSLHCSNSSQRA